jgi:hypothetical protein
MSDLLAAAPSFLAMMASKRGTKSIVGREEVRGNSHIIHYFVEDYAF